MIMKGVGLIGMSGRLVHKLVVVGEDTEYENVLTTNATEMIWRKSPATLRNVFLKLGEIGFHVLFPAESDSKSEKDYVMVNFVQLLINKPGLVTNSNVHPHSHWLSGVNGVNGQHALQLVVKVCRLEKGHAEEVPVLKLMLLKQDDVLTDHVIILIYLGLTGLLVRLVLRLIVENVSQNVMALLIIVKIKSTRKLVIMHVSENSTLLGQFLQNERRLSLVTT